MPKIFRINQQSSRLSVGVNYLLAVSRLTSKVDLLQPMVANYKLMNGQVKHLTPFVNRACQKLLAQTPSSRMVEDISEYFIDVLT